MEDSRKEVRPNKLLEMIKAKAGVKEDSDSVEDRIAKNGLEVDRKHCQWTM